MFFYGLFCIVVNYDIFQITRLDISSLKLSRSFLRNFSVFSFYTENDGKFQGGIQGGRVKILMIFTYIKF